MKPKRPRHSAPKIINTPMVAAYFRDFLLRDSEEDTAQELGRAKKNSTVSRQSRIGNGTSQASIVDMKAEPDSPASPVNITSRKRGRPPSQDHRKEPKTSKLMAKSAMRPMPSLIRINSMDFKQKRTSFHNPNSEPKFSRSLRQSSGEPLAGRSANSTPQEHRRTSPRNENDASKSSLVEESVGKPKARIAVTLTPPERKRTSSRNENSVSTSSTSVGGSCGKLMAKPSARKSLRVAYESQISESVSSPTSVVVSPGKPKTGTSANGALYKQRRIFSRNEKSESKPPSPSMRVTYGKPVTETSLTITPIERRRTSSRIQNSGSKSSSLVGQSSGKPMNGTAVTITPVEPRRTSFHNQNSEPKFLRSTRQSSGGLVAGRSSNTTPHEQGRTSSRNDESESKSPLKSMRESSGKLTADTSANIPPLKRRRTSSRVQNNASKSSTLGTLANTTPVELVCQSPRITMSKFSRSNAMGTSTKATFVLVKHRPEIGLITRSDSTTSEYHVRWLIHSTDTILDDVGDRQELFMTDECGNVKKSEVLRDPIEVHRLTQKARYDDELEYSDWKKRAKDSNKLFFYQKRYIQKFGRFEDIPDSDDEQTHGTCYNCAQKKKQHQKEVIEPVGTTKFDKNTQQYVVNELRYRDQSIQCGSDVFLSAGALQLPHRVLHLPIIRGDDEKYDENIYPEKYRKRFEQPDEGFKQPLDIGRVCRIYSNTADFKKEDTYLRVRKYHRPHNTYLSTTDANRESLNLLYWSDDEGVVSCNELLGKCFVTYEKNTDVAEAWCGKGPFRFYAQQKYNDEKQTFLSLSKSDESMFSSCDPPVDWPVMQQPLAAMDIFCGAGGLSKGLEQSGAAEVKWAIDCDKIAVSTFRENYKNAKVYFNTCQDQLQDFKQGNGPRPRGEVQLLCGGPPKCDRSAVSSFDNSPIGTFCLYAEYFRPRYVMLENVKAFLTADRSTVLRTTLNRLIKAGYQVTLGLFQCGKYGVPQCRRRVVILAAAPGEQIPRFPEPTHAFLDSLLEMHVNKKKILMDLQWSSGPCRPMTVEDAISDLPPINARDGSMLWTPYMNLPKTQYQKEMRQDDNRLLASDLLWEHKSRELQPLDLERIRYIPRWGDWRDLPNIEVTSSDGTRIRKLEYTHEDSKNGKSSKGKLRGVCLCATYPCATQNKKSLCKPEFRQSNTLIPWCLPHTGNRHGHWKGLFGRVGNNSYFQTIGTTLVPMGQTGRVVHPDENRLLSVRECARAQGFPDAYVFFGNINKKQELIGNAFPPPLAKAIGRSLVESACHRR